MRYAITFVAGFLSTGCGTADNTTKADAATGFKGQPCSQYVFCVQQGDGGPWNCDCGGPTGTAPCPASAIGGGACTVDAAGGEGCFACSEGAGSGCGCTAALGPEYDGGPVQHWMCIGSGNACGSL